MKDNLIEQCKAYGKERIGIAQMAKNAEQWKEMWGETKHPFLFKAGDCWTMTFEFRVDDFEAEVGFFVDVLGCSVNALGDEYAMFTGPEKDFFFSIVPTPKCGSATPTDSFHIEFMIADILKVTEQLEARGIIFDKKPEPYMGPESSLYMGNFKSPNGVLVQIWGMVEKEA